MIGQARAGWPGFFCIFMNAIVRFMTLWGSIYLRNEEVVK